MLCELKDLNILENVDYQSGSLEAEIGTLHWVNHIGRNNCIDFSMVFISKLIITETGRKCIRQSKRIHLFDSSYCWFIYNNLYDLWMVFNLSRNKSESSLSAFLGLYGLGLSDFFVMRNASSWPSLEINESKSPIVLEGLI